jgi:hypothetical protein
MSWGKLSLGTMSMGRNVHEASYPLGELSKKRVVRGASCPWGELSFGVNAYGAKCPWSELTMGQVVYRATCHGASCPGIVADPWQNEMHAAMHDYSKIVHSSVCKWKYAWILGNLWYERERYHVHCNSSQHYTGCKFTCVITVQGSASLFGRIIKNISRHKRLIWPVYRQNTWRNVWSCRIYEFCFSYFQKIL